MKICILDAETVVRENDVSLEEISTLGETKIIGYAPNDKVAQEIGDSDVVICNKALITREVFEKCPNLKFVGLFATGFNNVDIVAAKEHGAVVCNVPGYSTNSVAQHTMAFILNHFNKISEYKDAVANGDWERSKLFTYFYIPIYELEGLNLGIIGYGAIGKKVAELGRAFGMNILAYSRTKKDDKDVEFCSLDELLERSDVVTLHCPLNEGTNKLIDKSALMKMKKSALLVNTSRGGVIDEEALTWALNNDIISAAAVDVLTVEPMQPDCPLKNAKNITFSPHIAWAPLQTRKRLVTLVSENIRAWAKGETINNVAN